MTIQLTRLSFTAVSGASTIKEMVDANSSPLRAINHS